MQSTHTKIAFSIGRIIEERLKGIRREPLPDGLIDLLGSLSEAGEEAGEPKNCTYTSKKGKPRWGKRKSHLLPHLGSGALDTIADWKWFVLTKRALAEAQRSQVGDHVRYADEDHQPKAESDDRNRQGCKPPTPSVIFRFIIPDHAWRFEDRARR